MDEKAILDFAKDQRALGRELAAGVEFVKNPHDNRDGYTAVRWNGATAEFSDRRPERRRQYLAGSLVSLAGMVLAFPALGTGHVDETAGALEVAKGQSGEWADGQKKVVVAEAGERRSFVFVDNEEVVALLDEADGHETVTFALEISDAMQAIINIAHEPIGFSQKGVVDLLRRQVNGEYNPPDVIKRLRDLKFLSNAAGNSSVAVGKESISRAVMKELTGADAIPDEIRVEVPYYNNVRRSTAVLFMVSIVLCVDVDLDQEKFYLRPKAGELSKAAEAVKAWIVDDLKEKFSGRDDILVFDGAPTH